MRLQQTVYVIGRVFCLMDTTEINPRPNGVFPDTRPDWGGRGGRFAPPAICQTTGPILDPKTAFDSFGLELFEYVTKFYL